MSEPYRIAIKRPRRRLLAYVLLVLGALCLYIAVTVAKPGRMRIEPMSGVLVTREETLPAMTFDLVSLYASASEESAQAEAARYAPRGAAGAVLRLNGVYHAIGAVFPDRERAEASALSLARSEGIAAQAIAVTAPEVLLHVTATQQQLSALLQADAVLCGAAEQLGEIAAKIDAGDIDLQGAQGFLYAQAGQLRAAQEELEARVPGRSEAIPNALAGLLSQAQQEAERLAGLSSPIRLEFSSAIRCLQAELISSFCAYRTGLVK